MRSQNDKYAQTHDNTLELLPHMSLYLGLGSVTMSHSRVSSSPKKERKENFHELIHPTLSRPISCRSECATARSREDETRNARRLGEMQIEILEGGEILVNYKIKCARGGEALRAEAAACHQGRSHPVLGLFETPNLLK